MKSWPIAELVKDAERIVLLFTPAFDHSTPHPGYIMGYPPGIRENGGQYTHGSLWLAMAWARMGQAPAGSQTTPADESRGTLQNASGCSALSRRTVRIGRRRLLQCALQSGQSGWTWYTGSAAWMYRIWIEEVAGLQRRGNSLTIRPVIPPDWPGFKISYRFGKTRYEISAVRTTDGSRVEMDGKVLPEGIVPLLDDGATKQVIVFIAPA